MLVSQITLFAGLPVAVICGVNVTFSPGVALIVRTFPLVAVATLADLEVLPVTEKLMISFQLCCASFPVNTAVAEVFEVIH